MTPSLSIPTDNIYKFSCLFGLALIVTSVFSFVSAYSSTLDREIKYTEAIILLQAKLPKTKVDDDMLAFNRQMIQVTRANQQVANAVAGSALGVGLTLSVFGAVLWLKKIQKRDDTIAELQIKKLAAEVQALRTRWKQVTPPNRSGRSHK